MFLRCSVNEIMCFQRTEAPQSLEINIPGCAPSAGSVLNCLGFSLALSQSSHHVRVKSTQEPDRSNRQNRLRAKTRFSQNGRVSQQEQSDEVGLNPGGIVSGISHVKCRIICIKLYQSQLRRIKPMILT